MAEPNVPFTYGIIYKMFFNSGIGKTGKPWKKILLIISSRYPRLNNDTKQWEQGNALYSTDIWGEDAERIQAEYQEGDYIRVRGELVMMKRYQKDPEAETRWDIKILTPAFDFDFGRDEFGEKVPAPEYDIPQTLTGTVKPRSEQDTGIRHRMLKNGTTKGVCEVTLLKRVPIRQGNGSYVNSIVEYNATFWDTDEDQDLPVGKLTTSEKALQYFVPGTVRTLTGLVRLKTDDYTGETNLIVRDAAFEGMAEPTEETAPVEAAFVLSDDDL